MDKTFFVESVTKYCAIKGVKPTVACRESGAGRSLLTSLEQNGSLPSVEKVQLLAQYLGVSTSELLGEPITLPKPAQSDIGDRIFELVDKKYREQKDFAHDLDLPPSVISEWRRRRSASYNKRLPEIAKVLGTTVGYLLTGEETEVFVSDGVDQSYLVRKFNRLSPEAQDKVMTFIDFLADQEDAEKK